MNQKKSNNFEAPDPFFHGKIAIKSVGTLCPPESIGLNNQANCNNTHCFTPRWTVNSDRGKSAGVGGKKEKKKRLMREDPSRLTDIQCSSCQGYHPPPTDLYYHHVSISSQTFNTHGKHHKLNCDDIARVR